MKTIYVEKGKKNIFLINYILSVFPSLPISYLHKALRNKDIRLNDKKISTNTTLKQGDKIDIYITDNILFNLPKKLNYVYIDENILVVFKPQGILSNNENFGNELTLEDLVIKDYKDAKICHRLDRNTSGLLIFALNDNSYIEILQAFKQDIITKEYIAYVSGSKFEKETDTLNNYIVKDQKTAFCKIYTKNIEGSKSISTDYKVIYKNNILDYAVLKIQIHTGKTHQIRVQMQNISHPIIR
jgi:23S rRNA pseudouridine955/2504/2580 synthase